MPYRVIGAHWRSRQRQRVPAFIDCCAVSAYYCDRVTRSGLSVPSCEAQGVIIELWLGSTTESLITTLTPVKVPMQNLRTLGCPSAKFMDSAYNNIATFNQLLNLLHCSYLQRLHFHFDDCEADEMSRARAAFEKLDV